MCEEYALARIHIRVATVSSPSPFLSGRKIAEYLEISLNMHFSRVHTDQSTWKYNFNFKETWKSQNLHYDCSLKERQLIFSLTANAYR